MNKENTLTLKELQRQLIELLAIREESSKAFFQHGIERHEENNYTERHIQVILSKMQRIVTK